MSRADRVISASSTVGISGMRCEILPSSSTARSALDRRSIREGDVEWMRVAWMAKGGLDRSLSAMTRVRQIVVPRDCSIDQNNRLS